MRLFLFAVITLTVQMPLLAEVINVPFPPQGRELPSTYPFALALSDLASMRYQQVYANNPFIEAAREGMLISAIAFDSDYLFGSLQPRFQLNFSTTSRATNGLSAAFSDNVGVDDLTVFGPRSLLLRSDPADHRFTSLVVMLDRPFVYYPIQGNLLLDVRNFQAETGPCFPAQTACARPFRAQLADGDEVSRVYASSVDALSGTADTVGLLTRFIVTPFPKLNVSLQSSNLLFRWVNQQDAFTLQQSITVGPSAAWEPTGGIVTTNGSYKEVVLPLDPQAVARFFRLVLPQSSPASAGIQTENGSIVISNPEP